MENLSLFLKFLSQHIPNVAIYSKDPMFLFADKRKGNILQLAVRELCFLYKARAKQSKSGHGQ